MTELLANSPVPGVREPIGELVEELSEAATGAKALKLKATIAKDTGLRAAGEARVVVDHEIIRFKTETGEPTEYEILERGGEESTKAAHAAGTKVYCLPTKGSLDARYVGIGVAGLVTDAMMAPPTDASLRIPVGTTNSPFLVQNNHGESSVAKGEVTLAKATKTGNTLMLVSQSENSHANITAVESPGATWEKISSVVSVTERCSLDVWIAKNITESPATYKVKVTKPAEQVTFEIIEWAGVFELDAVVTQNTEAVAAPQTATNVVVTEGNVLLKGVSKEVCKKLVVGWGVTDVTEGARLATGTTITEVKEATEEVKMSKAAVAAGAADEIRFGVLILKAPTLTAVNSGDVLFLSYSGNLSQLPPGITGIKPTMKEQLGLTGFNSHGGDAFLFNASTSIKVELELTEAVTQPEGALFYSLQAIAFKFAPNNRGVAGTNAAGELLGAVNNTTGKMSTTTQTAVPFFVNVGPTVWADMPFNEVLFLKQPAGQFQIRFEQTATSARIRGFAKIKALAELKEGALFVAVTTLFRPVATQTLSAHFGPSMTELNTTVAASINSAGEITLPKATVIKENEVVALDGTWPLT